MATGPHTAVKQELLVRYLGYWTPAALSGPRAATYLDTTRYGPVAALRVFTEFADLLAGRRLSMLVAGELPPDPGVEGLYLAAAPSSPAAALGRGPVLAHLAGPVAPEVTAAVAGTRGGELLLVTDVTDVTDPDDGGRQPLQDAGFAYVAAVELVDDAGRAELLRFATGSARALERFKDELWAVDEFAGVRYRDPAEPDAVPLDISVEPHPGPLRRALLAHLAAGSPRTVQELRDHALAHTLYRPGDVPRALTPLLARGAVTREPERGRLTGATVIRLAVTP